MKRYRIGIEASLAASKRPTGVEHYAQSVLAELLKVPAPEASWYVYLPPLAQLDLARSPSVHVRARPDVNTLIKKPWLIGSTWRDRLDVLYSFGHRLPRGCSGKAVLTIYDTAFDQFPDCYPPGAAKVAHAEVQEACRRAARIVVPSKVTRQHLVSDYGYSTSKTDVILAGSRSAFQPSGADQLPASLSKAGIEAPFFLCVGRLDRRKNIQRVIQAYRQLIAAGQPCGGLVIAGPEDSGSEAIRAELKANEIPGERIVFTGYVSEPELASLYRRACALVYPSLAEGFGLPVLEALACGTAVITSNVSSMPEVAGDAAILVDPHDVSSLCLAMRRVLKDPAHVRRLENAGRSQAAKFTWKATAERLAESLLRAGGTPRD